MENLISFEQKILTVLENLQDICARIGSYEHNTKKGIIYYFEEMFPPLKGQEDLLDAVQYLKKNGLDISITFDLNRDPREEEYVKKYGEEHIPLGLIKGKNIKAIETIIEKNIDKIKNQDEMVAGLNANKKYSDANESISLKTLGITIKGNYITKGSKKEKINPTDKAIIYFLYYKSLNNLDECSSLSDLSKAKEIEKSERYIKNRITNINCIIPKIINSKLKLRIGKFIKNERGRGYRLSPKTFT